METKVCSKCKRELPVSEFYKCTSKADGLQNMCKECKKQVNRDGYVSKCSIGGGNPMLKEFTPRQLIEELKLRGYKGKLYYTNEIVL